MFNKTVILAAVAALASAEQDTYNLLSDSIGERLAQNLADHYDLSKSAFDLKGWHSKVMLPADHLPTDSDDSHEAHLIRDYIDKIEDAWTNVENKLY